jgi:hypothetical protein
VAGLHEKTDNQSRDTEQLRRRVETLDSMVTSADWDLLADTDPTAPSDERTATLANEVVSR